MFTQSIIPMNLKFRSQVADSYNKHVQVKLWVLLVSTFF